MTDALRELVITLRNEAQDSLSCHVPDMLAAATAIEALVRENLALKRGEFICQKCGIRKDGEHEPAGF